MDSADLITIFNDLKSNLIASASLPPPAHRDELTAPCIAIPTESIASHTTTATHNSTPSIVPHHTDNHQLSAGAPAHIHSLFDNCIFAEYIGLPLQRREQIVLPRDRSTSEYSATHHTIVEDNTANDTLSHIRFPSSPRYV
mmetsp:Transcript_23614/g.27856  ORF Transcript_23614/g.27856 Transcript_23614/m.27856 type:complete len:141 (+) Transcript_23614:119-541(+)